MSGIGGERVKKGLRGTLLAGFYWDIGKESNRIIIMSGTTTAAPPVGSAKTPADFLKSIRGRPVVVKLNSGVDYRGSIFCAFSMIDVHP